MTNSGLSFIHAADCRRLRARRDLIGGELAAGRNPAEALRALSEAPRRQTFREWADAYKASRIDVAAKTTKTIDSYLKVIVSIFGDRDPAQITFADVQEWVVASGLKASSLRQHASPDWRSEPGPRPATPTAASGA